MGRRNASMSPTGVSGGGGGGGVSTLTHAHQPAVSTLERSAIKSKASGGGGGGGGINGPFSSSSSSAVKKSRVGNLSPTGDPKSFV